MSGAGRPLDWVEIEACLRDLGDELLRRRCGPRSVVVVGGAFVAHQHIRRATTDVDVVLEIDDELAAAAAAVGQRRGLEPDWLNNRANPWLPATFELRDCVRVLQQGPLDVLFPPTDIVVLMKIAAGGRTDNDQADLRSLWSRSSYTTAAEAVDAFYVAYPNERPDPYLVAWLQAVIA